MKVNRKTVLTTAAVLGVAALIAGGTIAYFTDKESADNQFTVGKVDVTLYESQLHRMNSGRTGKFAALASDPHYCDWINVHASEGPIDSNPGAGPQNGNYDSARYCTPGMDANQEYGLSAVENEHIKSRSWGYSDQTIIDDSANYKAANGYFTEVAANIVPGEWVRKFSYAKNEGTNDAYVLIRYMVPTSYAANVDIKIPGTPYEEDAHPEIAGHQGYFTALTKDASTGKYVAFDSSAKDSMDNYNGYVETIDNVEYRVYAAVTTEVVNPGEMTFWSPVNTVRLKKTEVQTKNPTTGEVTYPQEQIDIKVDAQAVQAKTFADAVSAINTGGLE